MVSEGHGGAIVWVNSISAHVGAPGQGPYRGTKGAVSMLAKALGPDEDDDAAYVTGTTLRVDGGFIVNAEL